MASKYLSKQQKTTVHEHEKPGYRDALVARFRQKLWWLENENNRELYCNDVSWPFDRMDREMSVRKNTLERLSSCLARIYENWLDDQIANVFVGG